MGLFQGFAERWEQRRERRAQTRMECQEEARKELAGLQSEVNVERPKEGKQQNGWHMEHQVNQGWHQYILDDPQHAFTVKYGVAGGGEYRFRLDPGVLRSALHPDLELARHEIHGRPVLVLSAKGAFAGTDLIVEEEGAGSRTLQVGSEGWKEPASVIERELPKRGLAIEQVGVRTFVLPKDRAPLSLRYECSGNQGSMTEWYDLQPDVTRSQHEYWLIEGRDQPFITLTVPETFEGRIFLRRGGQEEAIRVQSDGAVLEGDLVSDERQLRWRRVDRYARLLPWVQSLSQEQVLRYEQVIGWDRAQKGEYLATLQAAVTAAEQQQKQEEVIGQLPSIP